MSQAPEIINEKQVRIEQLERQKRQLKEEVAISRLQVLSTDNVIYPLILSGIVAKCPSYPTFPAMSLGQLGIWD